MYKELYLQLFNAITDALERLREKDCEEADSILRAAQRETEARYMEEGENGEG